MSMGFWRGSGWTSATSLGAGATRLGAAATLCFAGGSGTCSASADLELLLEAVVSVAFAAWSASVFFCCASCAWRFCADSVAAVSSSDFVSAGLFSSLMSGLSADLSDEGCAAALASGVGGVVGVVELVVLGCGVEGCGAAADDDG